MVSRDVFLSNQAETGPIPDREGSPKYHAYQVEIPEGWKALLPFFYPARAAHVGSDQQDIHDPVKADFVQLRVAVLLCRQETDGQEALREFAAGIVLEAAFLDQDGQYLQAAPTRPAFAALPLGAPKPTCLDRRPTADCLVLLPLLSPSPYRGETYPLPLLFVDGHEVVTPQIEDLA